MPLANGSHLGPYEILAPLDAGGMGEVYRARDPRLGREVAIKVLPSDRLNDETRRRRFVQEARAASRLNHPNIVTIHEIEREGTDDFIVMELVPGRSLDKLIPRGGLGMREALRLAIPIADALARAHAAGIVHRDLKPANVVVSETGVPKMLDFGLAKLFAGEAVADESTPTGDMASDSLTGTGVIAGTPAYMSPEQAEGREVDARSDIFSFGSLLYEMVTGRRPFLGGSRPEILRAVISDEPRPPGALVAGLPADLDTLILRCLRKDKARRFQHVSDVKVLLEDIQDGVDSGAAAPETRPRGRSLVGTGVALAGALALGVGGWFAWRGPARAPEPTLVPITTMSGSESYASFSPDATQVAFCWEGEGPGQGADPPRHIWIKLVSGMEARQLTSAAENDWAPSWSPDGSRIAFARFSRLGLREDGSGGIYLVSVLGGGERRLGEFPAGFSQLAWSPDGRFVAARRERRDGETAPAASGIFLLPADGGEPRSLILPPEPGHVRHPAFSPDGRSLAYAACTGLVTPPCHVEVQELDDRLHPVGKPRQITAEQGAVHGLAFSRDGRTIVYAISGMSLAGRGMGATMWRVRTDGREAPQRMESVPPGAYAPATTPARDRLLFVYDHSDLDIYRFSPTGPPEPVMASSAVDYGPRISPDGRRIAVESWRAGTLTKEIWLADIDGSSPVQLTNVAADRESPAAGAGAPNWSPDGKSVVYNREEPSQGPGAANLWVIRIEGRADRRLTAGAGRSALPMWSRDGFVYYRAPSPSGTEIFRIPAKGGQPEQVTRHGALMAEPSWDGKLLMYSEREATGALFLLNLATGAERKLEDCAGSRNLASSPGAFYYLGCAQGPDKPLYRFDTASGRRERLGALNVNLGLTVSPDGQTILFARENLAGADLMMIENFR